MPSKALVELYIYDMSNGIANVVTVGTVGAIYHTGVFVFGEEYSYGPDGIKTSPPLSERPRSTHPHMIERIGRTSRTLKEFKDYIKQMRPTFRGYQYNVLRNNCNVFSDFMCKFLCGVGVPKYILDVQKKGRNFEIYKLPANKVKFTADNNEVTRELCGIFGNLFKSSSSSSSSKR